jgi:hypothetical protein
MKAVVKLIERIGEKPRYSVYYRKEGEESTLVFVDCFPFKRDAADDDYFAQPKAYDEAMELAFRIEMGLADSEVIVYETKSSPITKN